MTSPRLAAVIATARAAVLGTVPPSLVVQGEAADAPTIPPLPVQLARVEVCQRPQEAPKPLVFPSAAEVIEGRRLSRGAVRLFLCLRRLAQDVARARGYRFVPDQVTFHLPAVSLAGLLEYHADHIARLGRELERAGVLDCGGHAQTVMGRNMWDGTLWAVKMRPEVIAPRIRAEEWRHQWRPGFAADVERKTGAAAEMSGLHAEGASVEEKYKAVRTRAAVPDGILPPAAPSPDNAAPTGLRTIAETLPGLWSAHPRHVAREVGKLASAIAHTLNEPERRRYWCRVLWETLRAEWEGRTALQTLQAQFVRLAADLAEGAPWGRPGAVLAARLRAG